MAAVDVVNESSGRPLAYVAEISEVTPIKDADRIEHVKVRGWHCVVGKGAVQVGDLVVYCEIDSVLPPWDCFKLDLEKNKFHVKTVKLRGQVSQGYVFTFDKLASNHPDHGAFQLVSGKPAVLRFSDSRPDILLSVGTDLTAFIGVTQFVEQPPVMSGGIPAMYLPFPSGLFPKTDQPRIQNLPELSTTYPQLPFEVTEKIDGTSITVYCTRPGTVDVCSRNYRLNLEAASELPVIVHLKKMGVLDAVAKSTRRIALQGEFIGPGVCTNLLKLRDHQWRVFDVFLLDEQRFALPHERIAALVALGLDPVAMHVPVVAHGATIGGKTAEQLVAEADGFSLITRTAKREGLVFKSEVLVDGKVVHFKAVSNSFLLSHH